MCTGKQYNPRSFGCVKPWKTTVSEPPVYMWRSAYKATESQGQIHRSESIGIYQVQQCISLSTGDGLQECSEVFESVIYNHSAVSRKPDKGLGLLILLRFDCLNRLDCLFLQHQLSGSMLAVRCTLLNQSLGIISQRGPCKIVPIRVQRCSMPILPSIISVYLPCRFVRITASEYSAPPSPMLKHLLFSRNEDYVSESPFHLTPLEQ